MANGRNTDQRSAKAEAYRKLYKDPRWIKRRAEQLAAHPHCGKCAEEGKGQVRATIADHVRPHRGDPVLFFAGRLASLCKPHHDRWKQRLEAGRASLGHCAPDGRPSDAKHPWNAGGRSPAAGTATAPTAPTPRKRNERTRP